MDNAYEITGYSSNDETDFSTDQVRIEGYFKVADCDPIPDYRDANDSQARQDRLDHKIYYSISAFKPVTFNLADDEHGQIYDDSGRPLTITINAEFSASFNYWDWYGLNQPGSNECPPLQWSEDIFNEWQSGGIPGNTWGGSGMDFVLGGDAGAQNTQIVAIEITKQIVDEKGHLISLKDPVTNKFYIHYLTDPVTVGEGESIYTYTSVDKVNTVKELGAENVNYDLYRDLHSKDMTVGTGGIGMIYDYDVFPGMYYITEDKSPDNLPETITDSQGITWNYKNTYIETEYVWRNNSYSGRHVSDTYTRDSSSYDSIPEVLGSYPLPNGDLQYYNSETGQMEYLRNGFLEFYVYNVYEPEPIDIQVKKVWKENGVIADPPAGAEVTITLGRYKLTEDPLYNPTGQLTITEALQSVVCGKASILLRKP